VSNVGVKLRVKFPGVPERTRLVKVATPLTAATVVVPLKVPPDPEAIDATTLTVEVVAVFPDASVIRTTGWSVSATPLTAPDGSVVIAACVGTTASVVKLVSAP
jgi:hypothetical protein